MACTCSTPTGSTRKSRARPSSNRPPSPPRPIARVSSTGSPTCAPTMRCGWWSPSASTSRRPAKPRCSTRSCRSPTKAQATVYEHLKRALDFSAEQVGPTGICKGLRADWNDCLNLGGGESAMVSFLHHWALRAFVEAAEYLGRTEDCAKYSCWRKRCRQACESELWDGEWYIRGITRAASASARTPAKRARSSWKATPGRSLPMPRRRTAPRQAMDAVDRHLLFRVRHPPAVAGVLQTERRNRFRDAGLQGHQGKRRHLQPSEPLGGHRRMQTRAAATAP